MRIRTNLSEKTRAVLTGAAIGTFVLLSATVSHAGFQWVPPTGQSAAPSSNSAAPAPAVAAPAEDVEQVILPLPDAPAPIAVEPQLNAGDAAVMAAPPVSRQTLQLPPNYPGTATLPPPQQENNVLKVKTVTPPPAPAHAASSPLAPMPTESVPPQTEAILESPAIPMPVASETIAISSPSARASAAPARMSADPVLLQPVPEDPAYVQAPAAEHVLSPVENLQPAPVAMPVPAPTSMVVTTKVIMPDDAPQNAMDITPNSQRLNINPYPGQKQQPAPTAQPSSSEAGMESWNSPAPSAIEAPVQNVNYAAIEGFGSDMPLALALQQVVPADYAYSFNTSVNPGLSVTWDGGKPWDQVLSDMLAPHGLEAEINGKVVYIRPHGAQKQTALTPAEQDNVRRGNIKDPGEKSQMQAANEFAGIETAAGDAENIAAPLASPPIENEGKGLKMPPNLDKIGEEKPAEEKVATKETEAPAAPKNVDASLSTPPVASTIHEAEPVATVAAETVPTKWEAKAGESLKEILTRWSEKAGIELIWMASYDYKIKKDITVEDNFQDAVENIVATSLDAEISPALQVTRNTESKAPNSITIKDRAA